MPEKPSGCENITDMTTWINTPEKAEECRPCLLGVVTQWYRDELREKGNGDLASSLEALASKPSISPVELCEEFDKIKQTVPEELGKRLLDFDCAAQLHQSE